MPWLILQLASLCEITWAVGAKYSHGFTRPWPSVLTIVFNIISVVLLIYAMKWLAVGTAYAVWTGIGAVGTALAGIVLFHEPRSAGRVGCIALIVVGIVGLKYFSAET
jgi:quaternary ammonium compound-resistance protein SugE